MARRKFFLKFKRPVVTCVPHIVDTEYVENAVRTQKSEIAEMLHSGMYVTH